MEFQWPPILELSQADSWTLKWLRSTQGPVMYHSIPSKTKQPMTCLSIQHTSQLHLQEHTISVSHRRSRRWNLDKLIRSQGESQTLHCPLPVTLRQEHTDKTQDECVCLPFSTSCRRRENGYAHHAREAPDRESTRVSDCRDSQIYPRALWMRLCCWYPTSSGNGRGRLDALKCHSIIQPDIDEY